MKITVRRDQLGPEATPGRMWIGKEYFGCTLELPWKDNKAQISCIPKGTYPVGITYSPRFGINMLLIREVPGRAGIRIHNANFPGQLRGCLAVAKKRINEKHIQGGLAKELCALVEEALKRGETVSLEILNPEPQA